IAKTHRFEVPIEVINVPGDGARRAWTNYVDNYSGDGHVIGISSPNLTSDYLVGIAGFEHSRYTPIATLVTEYIAFAVSSGSRLRTGADLLDLLSRPSSAVRVALSTALGNPNHVAVVKLTRQAGVDVNAPTIRVFDTALDAVADVVAGTADVCAVTAASVLAELKAGRVRLLGVSAPERLSGPFAGAPTWKEQSVDCVIGAWRGVTGPAGLKPTQVLFWAGILEAVIDQPIWREALSRSNWSPMFKEGAELHAYLEKERAELIAVLGDLGLLKRQ
ncbi:MAG: tripartite tricarboxylate transporter substrate-binding protein, partial [Sphingobacteriales bacterium]